MFNLLIRGLIWLGIGLLLQPRQKSQAPTPPTEDDVNVPKATEGDEFGRVYGTVRLREIQTHWFGDFALRPITTKQSKK